MTLEEATLACATHGRAICGASAMYERAIHHMAIQSYAPIESIELIASLWDRDARQVLADIDKAKKGEVVK